MAPGFNIGFSIEHHRIILFYFDNVNINKTFLIIHIDVAVRELNLKFKLAIQ